MALLNQSPTNEVFKGVDLGEIRSISLGEIMLPFLTILLISAGRMASWPSKLAVTNSIITRRPLGSRLS